MAKAILIHETGGADVLRYEEVATPNPGTGEVLIRHTAIGLNYIDVYYRTGLYKAPTMPLIIGLEGAGVVDVLGEGVTGLNRGDRVAYAGGPLGAYAEQRIIPASCLVKIPDAISDEEAAAIMVQGLTAQFLLRQIYPVSKETTCLIHAAAGGVGVLLTQWAKYLGATVIATVGSKEKAEIAKVNGSDHIILYREENVPENVLEITNGKKVDVVYDSVGHDTFMDSLDCLRPLGMMVSYGQASGKIPPFDISLLVQKGSLFLTRPSMVDYFRDPSIYKQAAAELFDLVEKKILKVHIGQTYRLSEAAQAHHDLEARKTQGATLLIP